MTAIPVNLPEELRSFVDERALQNGYSNAGEYIAALVAAVKDNQCNLEAALLAGLSSGPAEQWTDDDWRAIHKRIGSAG